MSQVRTTFKNLSWMLVSQIIVSICGFIWTILIARYLGVSDYGIYGFALSLSGILAIMADLGLNTHIVRDISTDYGIAPKYLGNAIPLKSILAIGALFLTLIILIIMKCDEVTITTTFLFTIEMIFKSFLNLIDGTFQGFEKNKYQGIGNTVLNILLLLFILITVFTDYGLYGIGISYVVANLIAIFLEYYFLKKYVTKPKFEFDRIFCKKILILSIPFAITGILNTIYYTIDMVMLTQMVGNYATGIYNATFKLISILVMFYSIYISVIFPIMSKFFKNDENLLIISFEKSIKYLMLIMIPLAIATVIYSLDVVQLIYGHEYDQASSALSILIWTVCLIFISGVGNTLLNASHKEVTVTKIYFAAAVFNVVLNIFLIPKYSFQGAAITTVLSDVLIVVLQIYVIYKLGYRVNHKLYGDLLKIIASSVIMGIVLYYLKLSLILAIPVGIILYFAIVFVLKVFDSDDKYIIKEILGRN